MAEGRISVIIPVLDEGGIIADQLAALRALEDGPRCEVLVVDGDPAGSTLREIHAPDVRGLVAPRGRGSQMNAGARESQGDILLFLHADTTLPARAFPRIRETLASGERRCGAFGLRMDSPRRSHRLAGRVASLRSRLTREPYGNQGLFLAREHFFAAGGFRPLPVLEDVEFVRRFKRSGGRVAVLPETATSSDRRLAREGLLYDVLRNTALRALYAAGVAPESLGRFYPACPTPRDRTR
jgi:rSAM/selenodomain-associated transferase 2